MARPKLFDEQEVRDSIADVFTSHGFGGTSVSLLTEAAGMGKQSLYNSFGDKRDLYLQSLDCASARMAEIKQAMVASPSGFDAIDTFFRGVLCACSNPDPARHTCIVSAGLMEAIDDPVISESLKLKWRGTYALMFEALERGQLDGSVRKDISADTLGNLLMSLMSGLRVTARVVEDQAALQLMIETGLGVLRPTRSK